MLVGAEKTSLRRSLDYQEMKAHIGLLGKLERLPSKKTFFQVKMAESKPVLGVGRYTEPSSSVPNDLHGLSFNYTQFGMLYHPRNRLLR